MKYIVIQAGGRGSRMELLTRNKPKALVPVNNLPMIFHLFRKFPESKFIVIGDYKCDVLERYLKIFADVNYTLIQVSNHKGTCAGLSDAINLIPNNERFMLIWCDLILPMDYDIPETQNNIIGISKDFSCRWSYKDGKFSEERSSEHGVAGMFVFNGKEWLTDAICRGGGVYPLTVNLLAGYLLQILNLMSHRFMARKNMAFTVNGVSCQECVVDHSIDLR